MKVLSLHKHVYSRSKLMISRLTGVEKSVDNRSKLNLTQLFRENLTNLYVAGIMIFSANVFLTTAVQVQDDQVIGQIRIPHSRANITSQPTVCV